MRLAVRRAVAGSMRWIAAALLAGASSSQAHDREAADGLAAAERVFAAASVASGMKAAFLDAFADDATIFRPGAVNGKAFIDARPDGAFVLDWAPERVSVATSGELGYSSGPWRLVPDAPGDRPSHGQFLSVWKRDASGRWRVLVDHGIGQPEAAAPSTLDVVFPGHERVPPTTVAAAEAAFARRSETDGLVAAYRTAASSRMRLLRDDRRPLDGPGALDGLADAAVRWRWSLTESGTAASGDLAWTIGRYRDAGAAAATGWFVRVWRAEGGAWKILADVLAPGTDEH